MTWTAPAYPRTDEPFAGTERATLEGLLDWYRGGFLMRCAGLTAAQLAEQSVPPSNLSLLGLARHLADVERTFFRRRYAGQDLESLYDQPGRAGACFDEADPAHAERDPRTASRLRAWPNNGREAAGATA